MDSTTSQILEILGASTADYVIVSLGFSVVIFTIFLYRLYKGLSAKYQILNTNHMALWVMIAPDAVKWHHSGEYYIDMKALADIAEMRNKQKGV